MGQSESDHPLVTMSSISLLLLLLVPLSVSSFPVSLVSQAESLKSVLMFIETIPTYAQVLNRVGARADVCIEAIDDAIDRDIDDAIEAGTLRKVAIFLTKHREPILLYIRSNRFGNYFRMTSQVGPMLSDLAQLCKDIRYRAESDVRRDQKFRNKIAQIF